MRKVHTVTYRKPRRQMIDEFKINYLARDENLD